MKLPKCKLYRVQGGAGGGGVARARGGARQAAAGDLQRRHIQEVHEPPQPLDIRWPAHRPRASGRFTAAFLGTISS